MTKRKQRPALTIRVEYEPNRFSVDCLLQVYQVLSPTATVSLTTESSCEDTESGQQANSVALRPSRSEQ